MPLDALAISTIPGFQIAFPFVIYSHKVVNICCVLCCHLVCRGQSHHTSLTQAKRDLKMEKIRSLNDAWKGYLKRLFDPNTA